MLKRFTITLLAIVACCLGSMAQEANSVPQENGVILPPAPSILEGELKNDQFFHNKNSLSPQELIS